MANHVRFLNQHAKVGDAKAAARRTTGTLMETFRECRGCSGTMRLTVNYPQETGGGGPFSALIEAGFTITATWPVKTDSQHSLTSPARRRRAALLVARKRSRVPAGPTSPSRCARIRAGPGPGRAAPTGGLNAVDQLVGSFVPPWRSSAGTTR